MPPDWNAPLYDAAHSFVWGIRPRPGSPPRPQPGEHILDIGCGTGHLTAEIAHAGAIVLGVDSSAAMIAKARENFPLLSFEWRSARSAAMSSAWCCARE